VETAHSTGGRGGCVGILMIQFRTESSNPHIRVGTWQVGTQDVLDNGKALIDQNLSLLKNKKVIFICGGIGRIAGYAASLGIDAYNLDISELYDILCKKYYPEVTYVRGNMCHSLPGYDYAVIEECLLGGHFNPMLYKDINTWQKVSTILPFQSSFWVYRFNSNFIDYKLSMPEEEGQILYTKALSNGDIKASIGFNDVEDLTIEEITFDTNKPIRHIKVDPGKQKYTVIGHPLSLRNMDINSEGFRGIFYNSGFYETLDPQEEAYRAPYIPERLT